MTTSSGEKLGKSAGTPYGSTRTKHPHTIFTNTLCKSCRPRYPETFTYDGVHVQFDQPGEHVNGDGAQHFSLAKAMDIIELHKNIQKTVCPKIFG